ncbi:hypothetical protein BJ741DRAFT_617770 [Chytriomyces cf. hyalinus JEL632]|nr:hypothetical protein BJ741DRAFT_617770 [Chytriomyces cf. hyalinus JEL632]
MRAILALSLLSLVRAQESPTASSFIANGTAVINPVTITACGSAVVDDYGTLSITSALLSGQSTVSNSTTLLTYTVQSSPNLLISTRFTQDDINKGRVFAQPARSVLSVINSNVQVSINLQLNDQLANKAYCNLQVTIQYNYSPYINLQSSRQIITPVNQPVVISTKIYQLLEYHGLSLWNLNLTSVGVDFNQGTFGLLEYFSATTKNWEPLPPTAIIPYEWVDLKALRYNPNTFIGTTLLVLQVSTARGFKIVPWYDQTTKALTFNTTIQITSMAIPPTVNATAGITPQGIVALLSTPNPAYALMTCKDSYPQRFPLAINSPFGPYCTNFTTLGGSSTTFTTEFLGVSITLTTDVDAVVFFGTNIAPDSNYIPSTMTPIKFAGYLDYGAFYIQLSPATAQITSSGITFTSPEMMYDLAVAGIGPSQITGITFDPVAKTSAQFFVAKVTTDGPPQITMVLNKPGMFILCTSSAGGGGTPGGVGLRVNVPWGPFTYISTWQSRTFTYPVSKRGTLTTTIQSVTDLIVNVQPSCATKWVPGGFGFFDCFTIALSTSSTVLNANLTLEYVWIMPMVSDLNPSDPNNVQWSHFVTSLDGGTWNFDIPTDRNVANGSVSSRISSKQLGQWAVLGQPSAGMRIRCPSLLILVVGLVTSLRLL